MSMYSIVGEKIKIENSSDAMEDFLKDFKVEEDDVETEMRVLKTGCNLSDNYETEKKTDVFYVAYYNKENGICPNLRNLIGGQVFDETEMIAYGLRYRHIEGKGHLFRTKSGFTEGYGMVADDWTEMSVVDDPKQGYWPHMEAYDFQDEWKVVFMAGFYSHMACRKTMLIHASAVKYNNRAIVFTAPSGTGKTTQAELWEKYMGADILNGDKVFIRKQNTERKGCSGLEAWGSPWAGSSPYIVNDSADVAAMVVLSKANENNLRKIEPDEAIQLLTMNSFLPIWDVRCLEGVIDVIGDILENVPVYGLACRPDEDAVLLVRKKIFGY